MSHMIIAIDIERSNMENKRLVQVKFERKTIQDIQISAKTFMQQPSY